MWWHVVKMSHQGTEAQAWTWLAKTTCKPAGTSYFCLWHRTVTGSRRQQQLCDPLMCYPLWKWLHLNHCGWKACLDLGRISKSQLPLASRKKIKISNPSQTPHLKSLCLGLRITDKAGKLDPQRHQHQKTRVNPLRYTFKNCLIFKLMSWGLTVGLWRTGTGWVLQEKALYRQL